MLVPLWMVFSAFQRIQSGADTPHSKGGAEGTGNFGPTPLPKGSFDFIQGLSQISSAAHTA